MTLQELSRYYELQKRLEQAEETLQSLQSAGKNEGGSVCCDDRKCSDTDAVPTSVPPLPDMGRGGNGRRREKHRGRCQEYMLPLP